LEWEYCEEILPKVSRTFALNIGKLEGEIYKAVTISYLLFRIADTFEDNIYQTEEEKIAALYVLASIFEGNKNLDERLYLYEPLKLLWQEKSPEKDLIQNGSNVLKCYFNLPSMYLQIIDPLFVEAVVGMAKFQKRKLECHSKIFQLENLKDLEQYCYYVAGIVGIILTKIFSLNKCIFPKKSELEKYQVEFGLALQLTNIIKDWQKDLKRGWCYLPYSITNKFKVNLEHIDELSKKQQIGIIKDILPWILTYFDSALKYIETIPKYERSIRLFCIIPFVLACNTLIYITKMKENKIPREQVRKILEISEDYADSNQLLKRDYLRAKRMLI